MEAPYPQPLEDSQPQTNSCDGAVPHHHDYAISELSDTNGGGESDRKLSAEEVNSVLEIIASTGKFWHDWDELKSILSFQLKQVLSEYPEATKDCDQQNSSLGESFLELEKRLEEVLFNFIEGPPFTLQRLCEILLDARAIYPNLSKLVLALEKNLLVTSTLTKSSDPYPSSTVQVSDAPEQQGEDGQSEPQPHDHDHAEAETQHHPISVENGGEAMAGDGDGDGDEVMSEVSHVDDRAAMDMDTFEEIIDSSDSNPEPMEKS